MQLIETIIYSIGIGFFGSRVAVMLFDFMCYGGIFWKLKYNIAKWQGFKMPDLKNKPISIGHQKLQGFYDFASTKSFIIGLLDCKYCMTVWTSTFFAVIIIFAKEVPVVVLPFSVIFGYLITEKI